MRLLARSLCLLLCLALSCATPVQQEIMMADHHEGHHDALPDRCEGIEFDAIAPDEKGIIYFFKGHYLWRGFRGPAELSNGTFNEMDDDHHLGHVDAAFRMHSGDDPEDHSHDHMFFFLNEKVFSYSNHTLEPDYPKDIKDVFPGIPDHLDAAVECPKGECKTDSVIFFKGDKLYYYDIKNHTVEEKQWPHLPHCTAALRWLNRYYCFHGHNFTRFHPLTGHVEPRYPKTTHYYFTKCKEGHSSDTVNCTDPHLDGVASDGKGKIYAFRGEMYSHLDSDHHGWYSFSIDANWKEVHGDVDAVFFHDGKLYIIKDDSVYIYKKEAPYALVEGYPKPLKEELGIEGHVDAAFVCPNEHTVHVIQGQHMKDIDLSATPRNVTKDIPHPFPRIDAAACCPHGVRVYVGTEYFEYKSPTLMAMSKMQPEAHKVPMEMLGC
ncbi:hemopexin-like [Anguilla anguilla]|uniref:hemopexin-like n=1 Tax=Anguilla anguilla TaxID=7936 RepID=UPI0015AA35B4|nr:hemopexin-like [Anguilla anguilla]